jgi:nitroimidazol reductase NimA-like FMN-containing flavoprotein (pyridoxamine 5'-phosphate oxidase superfamily)
MGVTLEQDEIDQFLRDGHTVIVTTVGKDGFPHALPLWYVYDDGAIWFRKMRNSQGVKNMERDNRVACLVETGEMWADLKAVMIRGRAIEVTDPAEQERFNELSTAKYAAFRTANTTMPDSAVKHYAQQRAYMKVVPEKKVISWWNRKLRFKAAPATPASS